MGAAEPTTGDREAGRQGATPVDASPQPARKAWGRGPRLAALAILYGAIAVAFLFSVQLIRYTIRFPDPRALTINEAAPTIRILARDGSLMAERGERHAFLPLDRMPRHLVNAVIATEDRRYFDHWGLDPFGLARAFFTNLRAGRTVQGGSTLTQQLAKNLFLSTDRTFSRKLEELVLSIWLEIRLTKREILELYLNRVYFGGGAYGVEAAARRYFEKPARAVSLAEAAVIAGLLKAPSKFSPFVNPGFARARARVVLGAMRNARLLSPAAEAAAIRHSVRFADPQKGREATGLEYAVEYVFDRLPPIARVGQREIVIETTFDAALQKRAQAIVQATLDREGRAAAASQAALVVMDTSGAIRAMVGGRAFADSQFNRAVKMRRQPGSAFKPLVYLTAIEQGMGPDTIVTDGPIDIGGWMPRNDDSRYRGPIPLRLALAHSVNTVAVRLLQEVGAERVVAVAKRLGIETKLRPEASLALGTSEVGLLELSSAYAVLAAGGAAVVPHAIIRVRQGDDTALFGRFDSRPRMIVAPDTVGTMNTMLNAVVVSGTGRRAALARHQAAGKTGTTQDFRDAWFVGYTAHLVGGVWFGNDDGAPMNRVAGGGLPAEVWHKVMVEAHEGLVPRALPAVDPMLEERVRPPNGPVLVSRRQGGPIGPLRIERRQVPLAARLQSAAVSQAPDGLSPPVAARGSVGTPHRSPRLPVRQPAPTTSAAPLPRLPSQSIDPSLFDRAIEEAVVAPIGNPPAPSFNAGRIREALSDKATPTPRQAVGRGGLR